jgi:hypothetical protein
VTPARNDELREKAANAYAATGTVRGTAKLIDRSVGWTHALLVEIGVRGNEDSRSSAQQRRRKREREVAYEEADRIAEAEGSEA